MADAENKREPGLAWFCLRTQSKHEHIAAAHLRRQAGLEVFVPRIRFQRSTRRGPVWVTEALFPGYLFARFDWRTLLRRVHHSPGVTGVVHFGLRWPTVPDEVIEQLRGAVGDEGVHVIPPEMKPGDRVQISGGIMHGLKAVITQVMAGRKRVLVLLDFLGRQTSVEVPTEAVVREGDGRGGIL